ncbi:bifunctional ADP-dependent NAD(P)H-hydrate dehydratase/NAD(P)H-hydrate epimerase [Edwardsiella piscicida]|uniref:bifunctional ADP-dependent NAD(P)H-hydrate dehydratase/NAD(P)H-hydrate epimerase n=1 Tax=Edwardsiella piscicida TaxID=1263550 RepID=UPI001CF3E1FF|nr:bifunctional ADP-dependent NAD(P)H-hydrate dehydratase/NAD(P)H-hydrate epimerase [Edwardsiella piscicida]UCQ38203.1 bifunctional ADP-dependent NAD(P)H-hydrate dehydratase/NAD(P)H-hydrate epimerase [Edwardsiella piscicida]
MMGHSCNRNADSLSHYVAPADWVRNAEARAAAAQGITLATLMQRAGLAAFNRGRQCYPTSRRWLILCGHGNNGGDGYVIARLARASGLQVTLMAVAGHSPLPPEAQQARAQWLQCGGSEIAASLPLPAAEVIVDALLGIGLSAAPRGPYDGLITAINAHPAPVLSVDLPSGLNADTGAAAGAVVRADHTQSFICLKPGLLTGLARAVVGQLHCDPLGLTPWLAQQDWPLQRLDGHCLPRWLAPRSPLAHKGDNGRLLLIGGDSGMGGAIRLAGQAALRSGAGLVRVLTRAEHVAPLLAAAPELMVKALSPDTLKEALSWAEVVVVGPGLGQGEWGQRALAALASVRKPMLWDADALNLLSGAPSVCEWRVMTPHPGEAARLLGCGIADVENDRPAAVRALQRRYGGVALLKGAGTLIADDARCAIADIGNPGMASGGMGDILSGIIGGLLAQKLTLYDAACAGAVLHGVAADAAARRDGERGMLASDLLPEIRRWANP